MLRDEEFKSIGLVKHIVTNATLTAEKAQIHSHSEVLYRLATLPSLPILKISPLISESSMGPPTFMTAFSLFFHSFLYLI